RACRAGRSDNRRLRTPTGPIAHEPEARKREKTTGVKATSDGCAFPILPLPRLLGDDGPFRHVAVKIVVEIIAAGLQRRNIDGDRLARTDDLFAVHLVALELDRFLARVDDLDLEWLMGGDVERLRNELPVFVAQFNNVVLRRCGKRGAAGK